MRNSIKKLVNIVVLASAFSAASFSAYAGDEAQNYARIILSSFRSGGVCDTFSAHINRIADSAAPANIRIMQIDRILDTADKYSCVQY